MRFFTHEEFASFDDFKKKEYYELLREKRNNAKTPEEMEELSVAYSNISGYYNASDFARDLRRDAQKKREELSKIKNEKHKKILLISISVIALIVLIVSVSIIISMFNNKEAMYNKAVDLYNSEKYTEAKEIFEQLGDYQKSKLYLMSIEGAMNQDFINGNILKLGETIKFGSYDIKGKGEKEDIEWIVLTVDKENKRAFVVSREILGYSKFGGKDWETSDARKWLNGEFYDAAFDSDCRSKIVKTLYSEYRDDDIDKEPIYETLDSVSLVSRREFNKYFNFGSMVSSAPYADRFESIGLHGNGEWLLRTQLDNGNIMNISKSGAKNIIGVNTETECGLRPCMWIKLDEK